MLFNGKDHTQNKIYQSKQCVDLFFSTKEKHLSVSSSVANENVFISNEHFRQKGKIFSAQKIEINSIPRSARRIEKFEKFR